MRNIAFFGGSFDPIHKDHVALCLKAKKLLKLDLIYLIPNAAPPHKNTLQQNFNTRVNLINLAISKYDFLKVLDLEQDHKVKHYTYNSLVQLRQNFSNDKLFFIMGQDSLYNLHTWYKGFELLNLTNLVVMQRRGIDIKLNEQVQNFIKQHGIAYQNYNYKEHKLILISQSLHKLSSSSLRAKLKLCYLNNKSAHNFVRKYLNKKVRQYIFKHHLYADLL